MEEPVEAISGTRSPTCPGKHINCEATDEWKTNESATVGVSLEDENAGCQQLASGRLSGGAAGFCPSLYHTRFCRTAAFLSFAKITAASPLPSGSQSPRQF